MGRLLAPPFGEPGEGYRSAFLTAEASVHDPDCAARILEQLSGVGLAHVVVFAGAEGPFQTLMQELHDALRCTVVGCTTAGELGSDGYVNDTVLAVGFPSSLFSARTCLIENLDGADLKIEVEKLVQDRIAVQAANPTMKGGFSFMMVDGLSRCEDALVSAVSPHLAGFPLFGGSAGDGLRFQHSYVGVNGKVYRNAATLTFVVTNCLTRVFSINHMSPTDTRMVVTEADPKERVVKSINAEPAAAEYARLIGKDPGQLDELIFAANPVTVCIGGQYHVRAIQRVNAQGHLVFFSAIDEGMVLTVAEAGDMAADLDAKVSEIVNGYPAPSILGCDCVLRRIEAQRGQQTHKVNAALRKHGIVGFSTYGEQIGTLHVNHTMTGVAIFPMDAGEGY
ncbi:MAG: FIST N-terminal domain-containing protein [Pseudomonadota bacterium]